jgi:hypothetical protein
VPASIDEVTTQALFQRERHRGPPLTTPALFADALAEVIPAPLAPPPAAPAPPRTGGFTRSGEYGAAAPYTPEPPSDYPGGSAWAPSGGGAGYAPPRPGGRSPLTRLGIILVVLLVLAAIGTGVYSLTRPHGSGGASPGKSSSGSPSASAAADTVLTPVGASASDNGSQAGLAIDLNPATAWHTDFYDNSPFLGGLETGTGLLLDMGKPVSLRSVQVTFGPTAGATVAIEIGNSGSVSQAGLDSSTQVAKEKNVGGGTQTFRASSAARGRYVLIWFTKLPPLSGSTAKFEAFISNVVLRGTG